MLFFTITPVCAQSASSSASPSGSIKGVFDEEIATPAASPTAAPRAVAYLDTSDTPTSGAVENTIVLLLGGSVLIIMGFRLQKT